MFKENCVYIFGEKTHKNKKKKEKEKPGNGKCDRKKGRGGSVNSKHR
jgi:hypothetical protein